MLRTGDIRNARPTQQDVAERARVSRATVSAVINGNRFVSRELTDRVTAAIEELDYVPNIVARSMKTRRTMSLGLILPGLVSPVWMTVAKGVCDVAYEAGYSILVYYTAERTEKVQMGLRELEQKRVDGIVLVPSVNSTGVVREYAERGTARLVVVERCLESCDVDAVTSDGESGAYKATKHLLATGRRRIAMINLPEGLRAALDRVAGSQRALDEHGTAIDHDLIMYAGYSESDGYQAAHQLLSQGTGKRPDAILVSNHPMTLGALKAIRDTDLRIPDDIGVIGFDDMPWAPLMDPPLTVVSQRMYDLGAQAVKLLLARLAGRVEEASRRIVLSTRLVHRGSCCLMGEEYTDEDLEEWPGGGVPC